MGARKRPPKYRSGDCTLGWRGKDAVAEFRDEVTSKRQRVRIGRYKRDSQKAKDALDAFAERRKAVKKHEETPTVGQLWDMWLADRAEDGFRNDIYAAQWVSLKPVFANRNPVLLTEQDCRNYAKDRFALGRAQWTVYNELVRIRALTKWAFERDKIPKRPKIWVPRPGKHRDRVLTYEEAKALVAGARQGDPHIHLFVRIAFATAARHMAILDLTWERVDFEANKITFEEDLPPDPMSKTWRKGRATVPMGKALRAALEIAYRGRRTNYVIEHGGRRLVTVRTGFLAAVKRAGLGKYVPHPKKPDKMVFETDVTPHVIRHTVLTWLDQEGIATPRRSQLAGHKDEHTTKLVYTHTSPEVLNEAVELLDERLHAPPAITAEEAVDGARQRQKQSKLSQRDKLENSTDDGSHEKS